MPWQPPLSTLPLSLYKPSANCSYSMLVNKIKDKQQQQQPATTVSTEMSSIGETQTYVYETQPKEPVVITSGPILYRYYNFLIGEQSSKILNSLKKCFLYLVIN